MDERTGNEDATHQHQTPPIPMCELTQVQHVRDRPRQRWPFLYYQLGGEIYRNKHPQETKRQQLNKLEDALL